MNNTKEQIVEALEKLAQKLGVKAELIFTYYLKQAKLYKYRYLINVFISVVLMFISSTILYFCRDLYKADDTVLNMVFGMSGIFWIISLIIFLASTLSLTQLFTSIKNPEYMAISEILTELKGE